MQKIEIERKLHGAMLKLENFSSKISNLNQFKKDFENWSNVFK